MMRVLILHNRYQQRGGEDAVVEAEAALLEGAGHEVRVAVADNDAIIGIAAKVGLFLDGGRGRMLADWTREQIAGHRPEIVHIHNFFPRIGLGAHRIARESGAGVVQTLHNFRPLCAAATFLRNGALCEKCLHGTNLWGVVHRCYRNSLPGSLAIKRMQDHAQAAGTWQKDVHRFIALTHFSREKYIAGGFPADRIAIKSNFLPAAASGAAAQRQGLLFVGRLSREKGLAVLVEAMRAVPERMLTIVGDGPERAALEAVAPGNVRFAGAVPSTDVAPLMQGAQALIMPSLWYEGFPMTAVEAFANGLPIIASDIGSLGEIVVPGENGLLFPVGDAAALARLLAGVTDDRLKQLGEGARASHAARYTPAIALARLETIYAEAIAAAR